MRGEPNGTPTRHRDFCVPLGIPSFWRLLTRAARHKMYRFRIFLKDTVPFDPPLPLGGPDLVTFATRLMFHMIITLSDSTFLY
jgi:hypothetical protein